ncbi:carboxypeptidase-like regulatory domain-containing protein [Flavobacterium sp. 245]|uniref:carboxypeptidase-like regulatory domain-containing protein n=1 Tax=Flavobacterium sp. 245 TaxID=2512115 RepID=UPI0010F35F1E|nr:carboxypeptidase-like regulatory domain-containing protein [Flavobacterium sp. 245]TDO94545.1 carboxypeptidase-like protein [Flavobacterium sp. 245]
MKRLFLIFIFCPLLSVAQNITGIIVSEKDNNPIENTNIFAVLSKTGTISNKDGKFSLQVLPKFKNDEILEFSHIGYITKRFSISYLKSQDYKVILKVDVQNLSGVTIAANKKLEEKLSFKKLNSMKNNISAFGSFLKDDKLYVVGGDSSYETDAFEKFRSRRADADLLNFLQSGKEDNILFYRRDLCIYDFKLTLGKSKS